MSSKINIVIAVDVVGALSARSLEENIFLIDDSPWNSTGKGTANLVTLCDPGQLIKWTSYAVDLQTPVSIKTIRFLGSDSTVDAGHGGEAGAARGSGGDISNDVNAWTGRVPWCLAPSVEYHYRLEIQMGRGKNSTMHIETPALKHADA